jgi:rubredoxin
MFEDDEIDEELECPMCLHSNTPMGILGSTVHYSCRMCGWEYAEEMEHE